jgi:putative serine/threonine protein kinase
MTVLATEKLVEAPYASILCYPMVRQAELKRRLDELRKLEVVALEFTGEKRVLNLQVLGKGCVGIVVVAYRNGERVALKIRRADADRASMQREAELLGRANMVDVGPKLLGFSKDFLIMQFIGGELLPRWLEKRTGKTRTRRVLRDVLEQCWRLDVAGLDHGELSHAPRHLIVAEDDKASIVDFETASLNRRLANVTSVCQFLFIGQFACRVAKRLGERDRQIITMALRQYKHNVNRENFEKVIESCGL